MDKLLLLEDDLSLITGLTYALKKQGFEVDVARTLSEADANWADGKYALLILDVTLPDGTGFDFCRKVRQCSKVPIIFLTAMDEETNVMMGLDMGGDDYITKPFKLGILISRVNALLRRSKNFGQEATELDSNGIKVCLLQGQVYKNGQLLVLTAAEYKMLCYFMKNANVVLTKEQILKQLWDCDGNYIDNNTLTVYIRRLRMKIEDDPGRPLHRSRRQDDLSLREMRRAHHDRQALPLLHGGDAHGSAETVRGHHGIEAGGAQSARTRHVFEKDDRSHQRWK